MENKQNSLLSPRRLYQSNQNKKINQKSHRSSPLSSKIENQEDLECDMEIIAIINGKDDYLKENFRYDGNEIVVNPIFNFKSISADELN